MRLFWPIYLTLLIVLGLHSCAHARLKAGQVPDPILHKWFETQHAVGWVSESGVPIQPWCCDISDGYILEDHEWRMVSNTYQVSIRGKWYTIDAQKMVDPSGGPNPTGAAVVWYNVYQVDGNESIVIYCFAPGPMY